MFGINPDYEIYFLKLLRDEAENVSVDDEK